MNFGFKDKVVMITGSGSGMGQKFAQDFAAYDQNILAARQKEANRLVGSFYNWHPPPVQ